MVTAENSELDFKRFSPKPKVNRTPELHKGIVWERTDLGGNVRLYHHHPSLSPLSAHVAVLFLRLQHNLVKWTESQKSCFTTAVQCRSLPGWLLAVGEGCSLILEMGPEERSVQVHWCVATTIVHLISLLAPFPVWAAAFLTPEGTWITAVRMWYTQSVEYVSTSKLHQLNIGNWSNG